MFSKSAQYYDLIYSFKDYAAETQRVQEIIGKHKQSPGNDLLDIACGTGHHATYLKRLYNVEGLDLDAELIKVASESNPDVCFHVANMIDFELGKQFDVILSLFSSIGYVKTKENLRKCIANMARHLKPGGVLLIEPWFTEEAYNSYIPHALFIDQPKFKLVRMNVSKKRDTLSILHFYYMVATESGIEQFEELHELGLFSQNDHLEALKDSGLETHYDDTGLMGRGLHIGVKPLERNQ